MTAPEILLNNFIEKELRQVLAPLMISDRLICSEKFQIKDNFMMSNNRIYIVISLIVNCIMISFHVFRAVYFELFRFNLVSFTILVFINIASMITEFIINFSCVLNSDSVVKILLKIQEIDRNLGILDPKRLRRYKFMAWTLSVFLVSCQLFTAMTNSIYFKEYSVIQFYVTMSRFFFDMNIIYILIVMDFMASRINIWSSKVETLCKLEDDKENWYERTALLLDTYKGFLQILMWVERVFAWPILFYAVELFLLSLIYVEAMLLIHVYFNTASGTIVFTMGQYFSWVLKIFVLIVTLSAKCEVFYAAHKRALSACLSLLMRNREHEGARRMAKNVLRASAVGYRRVNACGIFTVDAALPLQMVSLVATYTVVLLQFAFL